MRPLDAVDRRIWTLAEARAALPEAQRLTEDAYTTAARLARELEGAIIPENELELREEEIQTVVNEWAASIRALGAEVKGLWLVDFDHGLGYYCWKYGESDIIYEHSYEAGFSGRRPIVE